MDDSTFLSYVRGDAISSDDDNAVFVPHISAPSSALDSASKSLRNDEHNSIVCERRYLTREGDLQHDFVPTKETTCWWMQYNHEDYPNESSSSSHLMLRKLKNIYRGKKQEDLNHEELQKKAVKCGVTSGKWILKTTEEHVDALWQLLACKVRDGTLDKATKAFCVKCSSSFLAQSNSWKYYTLCLYVAEGWLKRESVMRLRNYLHELGVDHHCVQPLYFKPDLYTHLPLSGHTFLWIDGVDTPYWFEHWNDKDIHFLSHR